MKTKNYLNLKSWLLMMLMLIGVGGNLWADETVAYTLDGTVTGGTSGYADASNINQNGLSWSVVGNTTQSPWRIGGKSLDKVNRTLQTNAPMGSAISKVDVEIGSASNITVTLFELIVASDADFNNKLDDVTLSFTANHTHEFKPSNGTDWPTDAYYKFIIRVTVSGTSNKFVEFKKATFYKEAAEVKTDPTITFNNESVMVGNTLDLSTLFTSDSEGAVKYSITNGDSYASIDGSTLTGVAAGSVTVKAEQAAYGDYNAGEASATITVSTFVQPTDITINMNYAWLGSTSGANLPASSLPVVKTQDNLSITITDGESTHPRGDADYIRVYKGSTMTFAAPTGYNITEIAFATGGNNTWNAPSVDSGSLSDKTWTGEASGVEFSFSGSCFISMVAITLARPSSVAIPNFSVPAGTYTEAQNVTITCATAGADIHYTTDGSDPTSDSTPYSGAITIDHSCTLKAIAIKDGESSAVASAYYEILDPNRPGTENNPYTVAQALEADVESGVYVKGIVSAVTEVSTQYHNVTYKISDDGTTSSDQFIVYRGKNVDNSNITSEDDVQVGDVVVVYGNIAEYQGANQLAQGNYIISLTRPVYEITAKSNNEDLGTVSLDGNIITATLKDGSRYADPAFTVDAEGEVTVEQDGNEFVVVAKSNCTVTINFEAIPTHKVTWSINGETSEETVAEGAALTHAAPEAIEGKTFVGWTTAAIDGETDTKPELVSSAIMGTADQKYYAVFANKTEGSVTEVTDELTREFTGVTENTSTYSDWSDKSATSTAVYAGQSAGGKNSIQLRSNNNNSGVISTTSGGNVKKVVVTWNSETASGRTLNVYGANTAYEAATDLYDSSKQGTLLGTIVNGTSTELAIDDDYQYIGLRSNSGAMYLNSISITWEGGTPATYSGYCTTVDVPIVISTVEELKTFRDAVNGGNQFVGKTVKLAADLDLSGEENWTPIGNLVAYPTESFNGVFDGDGHKISNVTVVDNTPNHAVAGLFGSVVNGTIKNLTVENVNLTSSHYAGGIVAYTSNGPTIENCHVIGGTITSVPELVGNEYDNGDKVGGIMGYATAGSTINNCTVDGLTIKAYRDMGGIVGFSAGNVTNNTVKNTTIIQSDVNAYKNEEITTYDYIVGRNGGATLENNVYEELNNVLTIDGAVAKIGDKLYRKLQAAVDAATEEDNVVTLLTDINLASDNVSINKAVTIKGEGHTIVSKATQAIAISGAGNVTIDNTVITSQNRGINVLNVTSGFTLNVENSTIQTNVEDPTTTYTTGENSRGINIANADGVTVNISNSTIQGYSYNINIPTSGKNLTVNMTGGKTYGRSAVNNWGSNNTITLDGVEVHGLNNQTGPTEAFACVVDNKGAQNNTFVLKDCQFTGTLSEAALTTEGSTASEHLLQLDGMNAIVKVLGSTTYSCNSDDKSRGGIFYTESYLNNNKLYFDDTTRQTFANAFELSVIADEKEAEVDLYPVSFAPEVFFGYVEDDKLKGDYNNFATPFEDGSLKSGYYFLLMKDFSLKHDITCSLASGENFVLLLQDYTIGKNGFNVVLPTGVTANTDKQTDIFKAAEAGYVIVETETETGYSYTAEKVMLAQPIIFHDGGEYEGELTVAIAGEGVKYTLNGEAEQTYSAPFTISETTTVKAWAEKDGVKSDEVEKTFTIVAKQAGAEVADGYYNIKTNDGKFVNVAGRKTVTLVSDNEGKAGTVIRVNADAEGVKVLRSQGVDLPRYAERAMSYVPELAKEVVNRLAANVDDPIIGEQGVDLILAKFNKEFDYHLYLEEANGGYRIYGKTPSMKHVVDFYANNKEIIDNRLPKLEGFVEDILKKVAERLNHAGSTWASKFKIHDIWTKMTENDPEPTLTEPVAGNDAAIARFYTEVLSSEKNVWDFAYQTAMIYWDKVESLINDPQYADKLGDYSKYLTRVKNIKPDFKYYIVVDEAGTGIDFISEGNAYLNTDDRTSWTLAKRETFEVTLPIEKAVTIYPTSSNGETIPSTEYYGTLYTDFAYDLPEGVTAYKVEGINAIKNKSDVTTAIVKKSELEVTTVPAQTPVLLMADKADLSLTLNTDEGSAVESELHGTDWLINEYEINSPTVEGLFTILAKLSESLAEQYEYLKRRNSGTVNNKYFFGIAIEGDFNKAYKAKTGQEMDESPIRVLSKNDDGKVAFIDTWNPLANNEGFMFSEEYPEILLSMPGDVNRDGTITIGDVTALVNIILGKATYPKDNDKYDFEAANVNGDSQITIGDVTALVNIILGK